MFDFRMMFSNPYLQGAQTGIITADPGPGGANVRRTLLICYNTARNRVMFVSKVQKRELLQVSSVDSHNIVD